MKTVVATPNRSRSGSRHQPELTRQAILDAAVREFANEGLDGARTEIIARAAGVNKALLYYYFKDKESLYGAVLDHVFTGLKSAIDGALDQPLPPRQKILAYAAAHFDYIAQSPLHPRLVQRGMMNPGRNGSFQVRRVVREYFAPIFRRLAGLIAQGIKAGEFRPVDPVQFIPSIIAIIVFYFGVQPIFKQVTGSDPLSLESLAARRAAVLDFIAASLFSADAPARNGERSHTHLTAAHSATEPRKGERP